MKHIFTLICCIGLPSSGYCQQTLYGLYRATADTNDTYPPTYLCSIDIYTGAVTLVSQQPYNLFYQFYFNSVPHFLIDPAHNRAYAHDNSYNGSDSSRFMRIFSAPLSSGNFTALDSFGLMPYTASFDSSTMIIESSSSSQYSIDRNTGDLYFWEAKSRQTFDTIALTGVWNNYQYRPVRYNAGPRTFTTGNFLPDSMSSPFVPSWSTYNDLDGKFHSVLPRRINDLSAEPYVYMVDAAGLTEDHNAPVTLNTPYTYWSLPYRLEYCRRTKKVYTIFSYTDEFNLWMGWVLGELNTATGAVTPIMFFQEYGYIYDVAMDDVNGVMCVQFNNDHYYSSSPMRMQCIDLVTETVYSTVTLQYPPGITIGNVTDIEAMPASLVVGNHEENKPLLFNIFPNPATNLLTIQPGGMDEPISSVIIFDLSGKMMTKLQPATDNGYITVDVSAWPAAAYLVQVTSGNRTRAQQFIKN